MHVNTPAYSTSYLIKIAQRSQKKAHGNMSEAVIMKNCAYKMPSSIYLSTRHGPSSSISSSFHCSTPQAKFNYYLLERGNGFEWIFHYLPFLTHPKPRYWPAISINLGQATRLSVVPFSSSFHTCLTVVHTLIWNCYRSQNMGISLW